MTERIPVDGRNPASLILIVMHDTFRPQLIRAAAIVRIVRIEGQDETFSQSNFLEFQITMRADASQAQPVRIVQVLEIGVDSGGSHGFAPTTAHGVRLLGFFTVGRKSSLAWTDD